MMRQYLKVPAIFSTLWRMLIGPHKRLTDLALKRKSRLLAFFLLVLILVFVYVDIYKSLSDPDYSVPWHGYLFLLFSFIINRLGFYKTAALVVLVMFPLVIFSGIITDIKDFPLNTLNFLLLSVMLSTILLYFLGTMIISLINILGILWLNWFFPELVGGFEHLITPLAVNSIGAALAVISIHHRNQIENERRSVLQASEERLRFALEAAGSVSWDLDLASRRFVISEGIESLYGLSQGEFSGTYEHFLSLVYEEDKKKIETTSQRVLAGVEEEFQVEYRVHWTDGTLHWQEGRGKLYRDARHRPARLIGIIMDITSRKRTEEATRRLRNYLKNIIDSMPSILIGVDVNGKVNLWNREAEQIGSAAFDNVYGQPCVEAFPLLEEQWSLIEQSLKTQKPQKKEKIVAVVRKKRSFFNITVFPLMTNDQDGAVIRIDDVTERVAFESIIIQNEKILSLGGLAAGIAHEINNPLAGIIQNLQVIQSRLTLDTPKNRAVAQEFGLEMKSIHGYLKHRNIPHMLELIHKAGIRAAKVVSNLLRFSHKGGSGYAPTNIAKLLDETLDLAAHDYSLRKRYDFKMITVVRNYKAGIPLVVCEPNEIQQVFLNILKNGAEAMHSGGARPSQFTLSIYPQEDFVIIEIEDNGPGMEDALLRRVFEPFFTSKPIGSGTGLGLFVSYFIIVKDHNGYLDVSSYPGQGTVFIIKLPVKPEG